MRQNERGQSSVEFAIGLLMLSVLVLVLVQAAVIGLQQQLVQQAAREAARAVAVSSDPGTAATAASHATDLDPSRLSTRVEGPDAFRMVHVFVTYRTEVRMPITGNVILRPEIKAHAAMRSEENIL